ncbi:hypothetical protein jhhlp_000374 [Lomentospora prolificans]|uniref:Major facilitator superfamily (MFS) profile domain-containing protein n=1 Tax=Lomentospora prolificans TaxID=41688 RepID=A0A2N3NKR5_9PEZI|nr:hypothetical protein jhhlp_000374 [Lomentospora prolificans]
MAADKEREEGIIAAADVPIGSDNGLEKPGVSSKARDFDPAISHHNSSQQASQGDAVNIYPEGWRLYILIFGLCLSLLLSTVETTIVSTSLVSITNALEGFGRRDWVVTSYLLTYAGFLTIFAKFCAVFGRKFMLLFALLAFLVFSVLCGISTNIIELIVFRAFQGFGGSGIYSCVTVITPQILPPKKYAKYMAVISSVFALASILGPVLGGAINDHSSWIWVFLLNAPVAPIPMLLILFFLPTEPSRAPVQGKGWKKKLSEIIPPPGAWRKIDFLGAILLLTASMLVVFAFEEAGTQYPWKSPAIIVTLILSAVCWATFIPWEVWIDKPKFVQEPIFPMRLLRDRRIAGMMLNAFFTGFPFMAVIVNLPQRFQAVNGCTPVQAGLYLLPLLLVSPFANGISAALVSKLKTPPFYILLSGSVLQLIGVALAGMPSAASLDLNRSIFGYEVLMGLGFGFGLSTLLVMATMVFPKDDLGVGMGALTQIRVLGGTISLAICATVLNNHVKKRLQEILTSAQIQAISESFTVIQDLPQQTQEDVRAAFAEGYTKQLQIMIAFSGLVFLCTLLTWQPPQKQVREIEQFLASK